MILIVGRCHHFLLKNVSQNSIKQLEENNSKLLLSKVKLSYWNHCPQFSILNHDFFNRNGILLP